MIEYIYWHCIVNIQRHLFADVTTGFLSQSADMFKGALAEICLVNTRELEFSNANKIQAAYIQRHKLLKAFTFYNTKAVKRSRIVSRRQYLSYCTFQFMNDVFQRPFSKSSLFSQILRFFRFQNEFTTKSDLKFISLRTLVFNIQSKTGEDYVPDYVCMNFLIINKSNVHLLTLCMCYISNFFCANIPPILICSLQKRLTRVICSSMMVNLSVI